MSDEKWLRQAAEEIRKEGHYGWGNTCEQGADRIKELEKVAEEAVKFSVTTGRMSAGLKSALKAAGYLGVRDE